MPISPMDEFLAHQTCETFDHVFTSDRNFYDRYYFNMHPSSDELFLITGMGQYPNLGTTDAFVSVSHGETIYVVRASRELGSDRMQSRVGPFGFEVLEGLKKVRVYCEPNEWGLAFDLTFDGTVPAIEEPRTFQRYPHGRIHMDTSRYSQVGGWSGHLEVGGESYTVTPDKWRGARDHSWGVRAIGEPEPPGIRVKGATTSGFGGFFHTWLPIQTEEGSLYKLFAEEDQDGNRHVEESAHVQTFESGGEIRTMGSPRFHFDYISGTRELKGARVELEDADGQPLEIVCTPLRTVYLAAGSGYIPNPDWSHGMYQGELKVEGKTFDISTPEARAALGPLYETLSRYELSTGEVGYGLLENLVVGTYRPHGFNDPGAQAP
ncbi:MAG: hypothetical protein ACJZ7Z_00200 [Myxococcota bacterium]|nr:MAG: hypothetical protein CBC32_007050 [Proteobacteria bacterium TMED72]